MTEKPIPKQPDTVACQVCLEEIPSSVAISQEADVYTQHFCGIECYALWKEKHKKEQLPEE
ncbi:MAG: DUF3330 domain-containing protein [Gammaproteobacteria bacterium]|jgi:hypothetical protein|nr:DUF3330 domain-containing protein [Gammaproteobacteria bacterium]